MITVFIWTQSFMGALIKALVWTFQTLCVDHLCDSWQSCRKYSFKIKIEFDSPICILGIESFCWLQRGLISSSNFCSRSPKKKEETRW